MLKKAPRTLCLALLLLFAGCSTLPVDNEKSVAEAFGEPERTALGRHFRGTGVEESRFHVLSGGLDALEKRLALAELVERSLDIQTYVWRLDETGKALLQRALLAADRGVRVRILLDDVRAAPDERAWLDASSHPNLDVRFFNPFGYRRLKAVDVLVNGRRINRRMHNKLMLFDESVAILGGRNIGDHYFGVNTQQNFRDIDLIVAGNAIPTIATEFDEYWNSQWALPVETLGRHRPGPDTAIEMQKLLVSELPEIDELHVPGSPDLEQAWQVAAAIENAMLTAQATVLTDSPEKIQSGGKGKVAEAVDAELAEVTDELLIEAAYFIPPKESRAQLASLIQDGARVVLLTNSLATTDVAIAHSGYKKHQKTLLRDGMEIFEMRPDARADRQRWSVLASDSLAALHTKAIVFDQERVFIGSYNFDPRSRNINTENGVLVESRELAGKITDIIHAGKQSENSYRLLLENDKVRWELTNDGEVHLLTRDPETGSMKRIITGVLRILPIESQL